MKRLSEAVLQAIGDEVRRRREVAGYSLEVLAERAQLSKTYVGRVENAQADFSISALWSIADALGCEIADLIPSKQRALTPDVLAAAHLLSEVTPGVRNAILALLSEVPSTRRRGRAGGGGGGGE